MNALARLTHSQSGGSQCQETFSAPCSDKQTHNYNTECSNAFNLSLYINIWYSPLKDSLK